jgi:hypothetical protein
MCARERALQAGPSFSYRRTWAQSPSLHRAAGHGGIISAAPVGRTGIEPSRALRVKRAASILPLRVRAVPTGVPADGLTTRATRVVRLSDADSPDSATVPGFETPQRSRFRPIRSPPVEPDSALTKGRPEGRKAGGDGRRLRLDAAAVGARRGPRPGDSDDANLLLALSRSSCRVLRVGAGDAGGCPRARQRRLPGHGRPARLEPELVDARQQRARLRQRHPGLRS